MNLTKAVFDAKTGEMHEIALDEREIAEIAERQADSEAAEREREAVEADKDLMRGANVPDLLALVEARQKQITADRAALMLALASHGEAEASQAATTLAQVHPVIERMLAAEAEALGTLVKIARALGRLV